MLLFAAITAAVPFLYTGFAGIRRRSRQMTAMFYQAAGKEIRPEMRGEYRGLHKAYSEILFCWQEASPGRCQREPYQSVKKKERMYDEYGVCAARDARRREADF